MGQFFANKNFFLPDSLKTEKIDGFLKAAFDEEEVRELLKEVGEIINPSGIGEILESTN